MENINLENIVGIMTTILVLIFFVKTIFKKGFTLGTIFTLLIGIGVFVAIMDNPGVTKSLGLIIIGLLETAIKTMSGGLKNG